MINYLLNPSEENLKQFYYGFLIGWILILFFGTSGFIFGLLLSGAWNWLYKVHILKRDFDLKATISYSSAIILIWLLTFLKNYL